jgi:hypothetical protein
MATRLKNIKLKEISLVDKGANPDAHIMLCKRRDDGAKPDGMNILERFRIDELSAVDRPAQVHAKMAIMKRDEAADSLLKRQLDEIAKLDAAYASTVAKADDAGAYAAYRTKRDELMMRYEREEIAAKMALIGYRPS